MRAVEAIYDGERIVPSEPMELPPNTRVIVLIPDSQSTVRKYTIDEVAGCLHYQGPRVSLEEMEDAIRRGMEERGSA